MLISILCVMLLELVVVNVSISMLNRLSWCCVVVSVLLSVNMNVLARLVIRSVSCCVCIGVFM